jgi:hypothetical protein
MPEAKLKTTDYRLAQLANKLDELHVKFERVEKLLRKRIAPAPPPPRKDASAAA